MSIVLPECGYFKVKLFWTMSPHGDTNVTSVVVSIRSSALRVADDFMLNNINEWLLAI